METVLGYKNGGGVGVAMLAVVTMVLEALVVMSVDGRFGSVW